ncbi:MAG: enoyl-CoA hydratase/isomerase family protein [Phycisphaerales bacterium]|nr:enoyl-CoA hydratase/isomerase family protein [Phycisphaerae bacterium]NNF43100.1 enoyl-CoA hydratase/isomerase family protein [Phycisphaerales bacterium]NNM27346.1 enoyl-CoA hydratase/isomerase family protein [Phycisphaerales bacterium]
MAEFVGQSVEEGVATIRIDRPEVHNAFNEVVIRELTDAFASAGADDATRLVVLASGGPSFSAGADVNWMRRMIDYSVEENVADAATMAAMLDAIRCCPKPVIARVHGAAFGGGVGLTAACDIAIAVKTAIFALTEVKLGILPAVISPYVQEKIGPGALRRYALTAERFDATEARRLGLVSEVVETEAELDEKIAFLAKLVRKNGPEAVAACKEVLREIQPVDWSAATAATTRFIAARRVSEEGQEGLRAFLDKRAPSWEPTRTR